MNSEPEYEISVIGTVGTIAAVIIFTVLSMKIAGYWGLLVGPLIALAACRPATDYGPFLWQRPKRNDGYDIKEGR